MGTTGLLPLTPDKYPEDRDYCVLCCCAVRGGLQTGGQHWRLDWSPPDSTWIP